MGRAGWIVAAILGGGLAHGGEGDHFELHQSRNNGASWTKAGNGLPRGARIHALVKEGGRVVAGSDAGAHISDDDGVNWRAAASGMAAGTRVLALAATEGRVFAASGRAR